MYCPDLYQPEKYRSGMVLNNWTIQYERYRTFITFLSPRKIKCVEEILLFNSGDDIGYIIYDLVGYQQQLYIFDSNDEKLEFHSFPHVRSSNYLIKIEFPTGKIFKHNEYRTISLHYFIEVASDSQYRGSYLIPLDLAESSYIHFEKPKDFHIRFFFFKKNFEGKLIFLRSSDNELVINETDFKVQINGKCNQNKAIIVVFIPELHEEKKNWFNTGVIFGEFTAILILFELIQIAVTKSSFQYFISPIIPLAVAAITTLTVIKGWIFTKDMDSLLREINSPETAFTYDRVYIALILIIAIEIVITIILSAPNTII